MGQPVMDDDLTHFRKSFGAIQDPRFDTAKDLAFHHLTKGYHAEDCELHNVVRKEQGHERMLISISKAANQAMGLRTTKRGNATMVMGVTGGALEKWNAENPGLQVKEGQRLVAVNGRFGDYRALIRTMSRGLEKGDAVHVWSKSQGSWFSDGWVLDVRDGVAIVEYNQGLSTKEAQVDTPDILRELDLLFDREANASSATPVTV
jgi:hypothetical protein